MNARLFRVTEYQGHLCLVPREQDEESVSHIRDLAERVPGAHVDEAGGVEGSAHALEAVLRLAGQDSVTLDTVPRANTWPPFVPGFQRWGADFMRAGAHTGVLNNDDVGLGKTVQTIAACSKLDPRWCKVVLCPAFLRSQWKSEVTRWVPKFQELVPNVHVVWPRSDRRSKAKPPPLVDWVLAFYLDVDRALEVVGDRPYVLVMDEIHNVRGYKTRRMDAVRTASTFAAARYGLTASLLYNDAARLHPILDLVSPGAWGNYYAFAKRYASATDGQYGLEVGALSNADELTERLKACSFRRVRQEVREQLPFDTVYQTVWLDPPPNANAGMLMAMKSLSGLASHLRMVSKAKLPAVLEQVQNDREAGLPSVTFTWLRDQATELAAQTPGSMLVLGGQGPGQRLERIQDYVKKCEALKQTPALFGTFDALGEGANLQWAKVVNLAALDYTPDKVKQAVGRAARMGQTGTVTVRVFGCKRTVDEHYVSVLQRKLQEQFKLDGRPEQDKVDLHDALQPRAIKDALASMYERYLRMETADGGEP